MNISSGFTYKPKVSVIIPNYNHAPYLQARLESVINQTFKDFEIIILDDASTDNSLEILRAYTVHPQVSYLIENKVNTGNPFKQWNKGVSLATGELIWIAESDDWAAPEFLENLIPFLDADDKAEAVFCRSRRVDQDNQDLGLWVDHFTKSLEVGRSDDLLRSSHLIDLMLDGNCVPNASAVLLRKRAFSLLDQDILTYRLNGDWIFWIKVMDSGNIRYCDKPLNFFRTHGANVRSRVEATGENLLEYLSVIEFLKHLRPDDERILRKAAVVVKELHLRRSRGDVDEAVYENALAKAAMMGVNRSGYGKTLIKQKLKAIFNECFR